MPGYVDYPSRTVLVHFITLYTCNPIWFVSLWSSALQEVEEYSPMSFLTSIFCFYFLASYLINLIELTWSLYFRLLTCASLPSIQKYLQSQFEGRPGNLLLYELLLSRKVPDSDKGFSSSVSGYTIRAFREKQKHAWCKVGNLSLRSQGL